MAGGVLPLLALFISATFVAASIGLAPEASEGSLQALCKNTYDEQYCLHLLTPLLIPSTNFSSLKWNRAVLSKAMTKARTARDHFMTKDAQGYELDFKQHSALKDCVDNMDSSVELLQQAAREYVEEYKFYGTPDFELHKSYVRSLMETASHDQEACYNSLNGDQVGIMIQMRQHADEAYKANKIAADVVLRV